MPTANYILINGKHYSPNHPLAIAWMRQNRSETHQNESGHTNTASKQPKRLKHEDSTNCVLQDPELKRDQTAALGYANAGKTQGLGRISLRFIGYRVRPLDPDNFAGGTKDLIDGLRHAKLIPNDSPEAITLETEQVRVAHRKDECTIIDIEYP